MRVVIADDHRLYRTGMLRALNRSHGFDVVGEAEDGAQAISMVERLQPDVALIDVQMPVKDGLDVARAVGDWCPVVLVSAFIDADLTGLARDHGAAAYIDKAASREAIHAVLHDVVERFGTPRYLAS